MRLPPGLVLKRIEDRERGRREPHREPERRGRLLVGELKALHQEGGDFLFLARFRFQTGKQSKREHRRISREPKDGRAYDAAARTAMGKNAHVGSDVAIAH